MLQFPVIVGPVKDNFYFKVLGRHHVRVIQCHIQALLDTPAQLFIIPNSINHKILHFLGCHPQQKVPHASSNVSACCKLAEFVYMHIFWRLIPTHVQVQGKDRCA
jgi:hypothetical protein